MASISKAFDTATRLARGGTGSPELVRDERGYSMKRQQEALFVDCDPDAFYPLLDDDRLMDAFEQLVGDYFIFTLSAALYLDFPGPADGWLPECVALDS